MKKKNEVSLSSSALLMSAIGAATCYICGTDWLYGSMVIGGIGIIGYDLFSHTGSMSKLLISCDLFKKIDDKIISPKVFKKKRYEDKTVYYLSLPQGLCLSDFDKKKEQIEQALNSKVDFEYNNKRIIMTVNKITLEETYPFETLELKGDLPIVVGHTLDGIKTFDLATAASPHLGVYGETNGGKSVILRNIITQLILNKSPEELEFHLIDLKRVELSIFKKSNMVKSFSNTLEQAEKILNDICDMTDKRYMMLEEKEVVSLKGYNAKVRKKLPYVLVVIDEFTDLSESKTAIEKMNYFSWRFILVIMNLIMINTGELEKQAVI